MLYQFTSINFQQKIPLNAFCHPILLTHQFTILLRWDKLDFLLDIKQCFEEKIITKIVVRAFCLKLGISQTNILQRMTEIYLAFDQSKSKHHH